MPRFRTLFILLAAFATSANGRTLLLPSETDSGAVHDSPNAQIVNFQPLIGILSQPGDGDGGETIDGKLLAATNPLNYSYIAASYVKWVEMAGARAVPLIYNEPEEVLRKDMGFLQEEEFDSKNHAATLTFVSPEAKTRSYFSWLPESVRDRLEEQPLTIENHQDGNTIEKFLGDSRLTRFFSVLTTTADRTGKVYVSTIEGRDHPVYATQWHPEKPAYEWGLSEIPHSAEAVLVTQATANFFVNEARKSTHAPPSESERDAMLIYNFDPIFSGKDGTGFFDQSYIFNIE